jgi:putative Mg2+ transporter-C (MgtC) family protein
VDYDIPIKLVLAAVLGGCVGIERQMWEKPAGLRTNMLICVGTTLFMTISLKVGALYGDSTRIAAQIITGIGFLGAGAVLHSHGFVLGLTTAATIWVVAGVGMAVGAGFYGTAVFATLLSLATLTLMASIEQRLQGHRVFSYLLTVVDVEVAMSTVKKLLEELAVAPPCFNFRKDHVRHRLWFNATVSRDLNQKIVERLSQSPDVVQVENGMSVQDFIHPLRPHGE